MSVCVRVCLKRCILKNWLMKLWGLACTKFVEQAGRLEGLAGVDTGVLRKNFSLENLNFCC